MWRNLGNAEHPAFQPGNASFVRGKRRIEVMIESAARGGFREPAGDGILVIALAIVAVVVITNALGR